MMQVCGWSGLDITFQNVLEDDFSIFQNVFDVNWFTFQVCAELLLTALSSEWNSEAETKNVLKARSR